MWIIDYLNPVRVFSRARLIAKDVSNYMFYRKSINKMIASGLIRDKGMRTDRLRRVYFVINLQPETLLAGPDIDLLERSRVTEAIASRNEIFVTDGLLEIIIADYERIKTDEYYAYLIWIKYRKLTEFADWLNVIVWLGLATVLAFNYQLFIEAFEYVKNLYFQINN